MAELSINISDLFEQQFGYKTNAFNFSRLPDTNRVAKGGTDLIDRDAYGREFFMPVWIGPDVNSYVELSYPVIRVECKKTIVETSLTERNGTVKELINTQDYKITIRGIIVGLDNQWPEDSIVALNDLFRIQQPLLIKSALTDIFLITPERNGYNKVVMTSISFPEGKGAKNVRGYQMEFTSDQIFSLIEI